MKMTKWFFEGYDIKFISTEENLDRHILTNREKLQAHGAKIIIENEYNDPNQSPTANCPNCNGSTKSKKIKTVPVDSKNAETPEQKTIGLFRMSGDVDATDTTTDLLEDKPDLELLNGSGDRLAL